MRASPIVVGYPGTEAVAGLASRLEGVEEDAFVFEAAPQPLNEDIVHPAAAAVHGDADAGVLQRRREGKAGELAPLIRVEDVGLAVAGNRLFKRCDAEVGIHRVRQPPGQHLATEPVHDGDEVKEAAPHRDIGHIRTPDLIRPLDRQMPQQVRIDAVLRMWFAGLRRLIDRRQTDLAHEPPNPLAAHAPALASQMPRHLAGAIPGHLHEGLVDDAHQFEGDCQLVCPSAFT